MAGNYTNTVKALAKDIVSYVRSVYVYEDLDKATIARLTAIIGEDYDYESVPDTSCAAIQNTPGLSSASLELRDAPTFRFYIDGSYDASLYRFTVNGIRVDSEILVDTDGRVFIRVAPYAHSIATTVSYTIVGTDISGSFNLKAYYNYALTLDDANLVSLVERLWKYSESAKAYKIEATSK